MRRKLIATAFLGFSAVAFGVDSSARLVLQVRPEAALLPVGDNAVRLKIRLAPGAQATLWASDSCEAPLPNGFVVSRAGAYLIPLSAIENTGSRNICLASSDGALNSSISLLRR